MPIKRDFCKWICRVFPPCLSTWMWVDMALDTIQTINYYDYAFNNESTYQIWLQGQCLDQGLLNWIIFLFLDFYLNLPPLNDLKCCSIDFFRCTLQGLNARYWTRPISELLLLSGPLLLLFSPSSVLPRGFSNLDRSNLKAPGLIRQLHFLEDSGLCLSLPFKLRFQISSQSMFIRPLFHWSGSITCPSILLAAS